MDWIEKAAENMKEERKQQDAYNDFIKKFEEEILPQKLGELWQMFAGIYDRIKAVLPTEVQKDFILHQDRIEIRLGDVTIKARQDKQEYLGILASVNVEFSVANAAGGPRLPFNDIRLINRENPQWVVSSSEKGKRIEFTQQQAEEIFKIAMWKYLR